MSGERSEPGLVPSKTTHGGGGSGEMLSAVAARVGTRPESQGSRIVGSNPSGCHSGGFVPLTPGAGLQRRLGRMRKAVWGAAHFLSHLKGHRAWFVTLTYREVDQWKPEHLTQCMNRIRDWCALRGVKPAYVWVGELQKRGALHYHVAVWLPKALSLPKPDKAGWWPHGMSQRALAIAPIGYLMKYVSKGDTREVAGLAETERQARFPKGARIYGMGGLETAGRQVVAWLNFPEWAKNAWGVGSVRRVGHRMVVNATGEVLESPWRVEHVPGGLWVHQVGQMAPRLHGGPYSSVSFGGLQ
jgi:hypothetical protein